MAVTTCLAAGQLRRSRRWLLPIINETARSRGENPPGFSTVLNWLDEYERHGHLYGTAAYSDRHDLKGSRVTRLMPYQERAIDEGIDAWLMLRKKRLGYDVVCAAVAKYDEEHGHEIDKGALGPKYVDQKGKLLPPSIRTFERRTNGIDRMVVDWAMKGPAYAKQRNQTRQTTKVGDRAYAEVEVDHCTLDILIIDDQQHLVLGRPDLVIFRDRATAMVLGYGLGFEEPSYSSFVQGLRHTMYPKDLSDFPDVKNPWPCFGRIENLYVDNAMHFVGYNIESAGSELGFNIVRLPPRQPWFKGALERFFGTLNSGLVHMLPGTTLQDILARKDHETLGKATFTLHEFEAMLVFWICDIYHDNVTKALGPIRGIGGRPLSAWKEKVCNFATPLLPAPETFIALAGDIDYRTIQRDGIVWDYIKYESRELWALLSNPHHTRSSDGSTRYKVVRDPLDLENIFVHVPWNNTILTVPAALGHRQYAAGLSLHQHRVILSHARSSNKKEIEMSDLQANRSRLAAIATALRTSPGRKHVQRAVAAYLNVELVRRTNKSDVRQSSHLPDDLSDLTEVGGAIEADTDGARALRDKWDEENFERALIQRSYNSYVDE